MKKFLLLLSLLSVGCDDATEDERIAFAQKKYNTVEVISVGGTSPMFIVRDGSNQVWKVYINSVPEVVSEVIVFSSKIGEKPNFQRGEDPMSIEPNL